MEYWEYLTIHREGSVWRIRPRLKNAEAMLRELRSQMSELERVEDHVYFSDPGTIEVLYNVALGNLLDGLGGLGWEVAGVVTSPDGVILKRCRAYDMWDYLAVAATSGGDFWYFQGTASDLNEIREAFKRSYLPDHPGRVLPSTVPNQLDIEFKANVAYMLGLLGIQRWELVGIGPSRYGSEFTEYMLKRPRRPNYPDER